MFVGRDAPPARVRVHDSAAVGDDGRRRRLLGVEESPARDRDRLLGASCSRSRRDSGFGGAIGGWLLASYGYVPNVAQTEHALQGIRLTVSLFPAATFPIGVVCLFFYKIDKRLEIQITDELAERRRAYGCGGDSGGCRRSGSRCAGGEVACDASRSVSLLLSAACARSTGSVNPSPGSDPVRRRRSRARSPALSMSARR